MAIVASDCGSSSSAPLVIAVSRISLSSAASSTGCLPGGAGASAAGTGVVTGAGSAAVTSASVLAAGSAICGGVNPSAAPSAARNRDSASLRKPSASQTPTA